MCLAVAALALGVSAGAAAARRPGHGSQRAWRAPLHPGPLRAAGRYLVDPDGRVVILHGLFAVWKQPPYFPAGMDDPAQPSTPSFTGADANLVRTLGFDGVRLAWYWEGLEPAPGRYSGAYLAGIAGAERRFASRGVYVVLDAHQDQYDQLFGNEPGFPTWSAITGGAPLAPAPTDPGYTGWKFPLGYFHLSTELAFGNLYANGRAGGVRIATAFGQAWQVIARRFRADPMLAGYDLINEPFPGTNSASNPYVGACSSQAGCPDFDEHVLEPFELRLAGAIRRVDPMRTVFLEPTFFFNVGISTPFTRPAPGLRPAGLSFHDQCPSRTTYAITHDPSIIVQGHTSCPPVSAAVLRNAQATATALSGPALMTEVASTSDADAQGLNCLLEQADQSRTGYTYGLSWSNPDDELRRLAAESQPDGTAPYKELVLARVYPRAIAGIPQDYGFDVRTGRFHLRYRPSPFARAPTLISVPVQFQYPLGYDVRAIGARVVSAPGAPLLALVNRRRAQEVSITVTPAAPGGVSRPQFPPCPATPAAP